jgi:hypothetical protein
MSLKAVIFDVSSKLLLVEEGFLITAYGDVYKNAVELSEQIYKSETLVSSSRMGMATPS